MPLFSAGTSGTLAYGRESTFHQNDLRPIISGMLTRKQRNNGLGKHVAHVLTNGGNCTFAVSRSTGFTGFRAAGMYRFYLRGTSSILVNRLNRDLDLRAAVDATRLQRTERRRLRALGLIKKPIKKASAPRLGDNARLKRHFRNSKISWDLAVSVIAHAARLPFEIIRKSLQASLENGIATMKLNKGFAFRVELSRHGRLADLSGPVSLMTTNDNTSLAYRRLRNRLRKEFDGERRERLMFRDADRAARKRRQRELLRIAV